MRLMGSADTFTWRPIKTSDVTAWASLLAAIREADGTWDYFSAQDLLEDFDAPGIDYGRGSTAIFHGATMAGYGTLAAEAIPGPVHAMSYYGGVHPAYRGRGLGSHLLAWAEAAAIPLHRDRHPGAGLSLSGTCMARDASAAELYAGLGYQPVRWFHSMVRDLYEPMSPDPPPPGIEITGLVPERSEHARLVRNEAFRDHWGSTETSAEMWAHLMSLSPVRPGMSFLAYCGAEPVGLLLGHEYDEYTEATGIRDLYIALVGTLRPYRKRGIGSALMTRAMSEARAAGFTAASLTVNAESPTGALGLYERSGFTVNHTTVTQEKVLLSCDDG